MDLTYTGRANKRTITTADLAGKGIEGFETTVWLRAETKTVQDAGGQWILDNISDQFALAPAQASTMRATRKAPDSTSSPDKPSSGS